MAKPLKNLKVVLFTFDFLVEYVRINEGKVVSDKLAVAVRLLDFPTLIIYQPEQRCSYNRNKHVFKRGKSCSFEMNMEYLHSQLSSNPLSVMILDVKEEIPKLIGTCFIPLAKVLDRIRQNVADPGVSSDGERGTVNLRDLRGDTAGSMTLSYKLSATGGCLQPQVMESIHSENVSTDKESAPASDKRSSVVHHALSSTRENTGNDPLENTDTLEQKQRSSHDDQNTFNENIFCPPYLYYCNSGVDKLEGWETNVPEEVYTYKDSCSEEESTHSTDDKVARVVKPPQDSVVANVPGDALRQLPLLNALLVELSQLSGQNSCQPLSIHPNLARIYHPISPEPAIAQVSAPRMELLPQNSKQRVLSSPRHQSTPLPSPKQAQKNKPKEANKNSTKNKWIYRTTKTYEMRLKKNSAAIKQRECVMLLQNNKESLKVKTSSKRESVDQDLSVCASLEDEKRKPQESSSIHVLEKHPRSSEVGSQGQQPLQRDSNVLQGNTEVFLEQQRELVSQMCPGSDLPTREETSRCLGTTPEPPQLASPEHQTDSNHPGSESEEEKTHLSKPGQRSPRRSSVLNSSCEENEEANYDDDFNSLDPTDSGSPDSASSPEHPPARTPKSQSGVSDSDSDAPLRIKVLPVQSKTRHSPHQTQSGTRPQDLVCELPFLSDESDADGSTTSKKSVLKSIKGDGASLRDSDGSSSGQKKSLKKNSEHSIESATSFHQTSEEEERDELGTLDFRKEYKHISELVANKLPGYTM